MARLDGIQRSLAIRPSHNLVMLERHLHVELDCVLSQEEELWALKPRMNWMMFGDRNTSFYHISTLVRRKRNTISAIMSTTGEWVHDENEVKEVIRNGFAKLYSTSLCSAPRLIQSDNTWHACITDEDWDSLDAEVT